MRRAAVLFVLLALLYCGAGLLPGRVLGPVDMVADAGAWKGDLVSRVRVSNSLLSDVVTQFMAWDAETLRLLRLGEMPWRNRWAGEGAPLFANPQTALLSPFTWPRLLFGDTGWALCAILRFVVAALSMRWLARAMGATPFAATLSAFVYATSGYAVLWLLYPLANVVAVLPALGAAALEGRRGLVVLFAALATIGGHPETLSCGVLGIAGLVWWASGLRRAAGGGSSGSTTSTGVRHDAVVPYAGLPLAAPRSLLSIALAALGGFLLCGVVLVPFFRILWASDARVVRVAATPPGVRWSGIAGTILPGFLGSPLKGELDLTALQPLPENFILRSEAFVGLIVLVAIALAWRRLPPLFRRGLIIALIGFVLSLRLPGLRLISRVVPVVIEYMTVVFALFTSAAAGPALEGVGGGSQVTGNGSQVTGNGSQGDGTRYPSPGTSSSVIAYTLIAAGLALALGGAFVALPAARPALTSFARAGITRLRARGVLQKPAAVYEERLEGYLAGASTTAVRRALIPGLCWAAAGFALARRRRRLLIAAAAAELLAFGLGFNPAVARVTAIPPPLAQLQRLDPAHEYFAASSLAVFPANLGTLYGVRDAVSYDSLQSRPRVEALAAAGYDRVTQSLPPTPNPALARLGVRWLVTPSGVVEVPNAQHPPPPRNDPPEGLGWGVAVTLVGAVVSVVACRLSAR